MVAIPFREGNRVSKGAVVLKLDDQLQSAELSLAERERETAEAQHDQACFAAERAAREKERISRLLACPFSPRKSMSCPASRARLISGITVSS